jgi:hypothetical protein
MLKNLSSEGSYSWNGFVHALWVFDLVGSLLAPYKHMKDEAVRNVFCGQVINHNREILWNI